MEKKLTDLTPLVLLFIPVVIALIGVIVSFNIIDFVYLTLVGVLFLKYLIMTKKQK
ncbi:MAG TPA: hypothetical protein IAC20_06400 [Candidatus Faecisoma merdavium]|nr:hypothetical protein [Candidatus Faecisoma merdavium]